MPDTKWDPRQYNKVADFVAKLGEPLIGLLSPQEHHDVLDLGCGDASLSIKLKPLCRKLIGIDASPEMVAAANSRGIEAYVQDAHALNYVSEFDSVFSNAALHWMQQPQKVLSGIHKALKPEGTFVAEFGGHGNAHSIVEALTQSLNARGVKYTNPWFFPKPDQYSKLLHDAGFAIAHIELFDRFTPLPGHITEWITTFGQTFLARCSNTELNEVLRDVTQSVQVKLLHKDKWHVDYVRLRVKAIKI